jgi:hypothetical protein
VDIPDPYTGAPSDAGLFSVAGMRSERGWEIGVVQLHQLTGASFPTLAHFLPALWSTYLAVLVWATLRPAPGAWAAAAFTVLMPTTVRFLGPGFLVPSAFALPWILAVLATAVHARGPGRFAALLLLITGAFFVHLVPGVLALFTGFAAALLHPARWQDRLGLAASVALPLVWIYPSVAQDLSLAIGGDNGLPFAATVFRSAGTLVLVLAVLGTAAAWYNRTSATAAHRVLVLLCAGLAITMAASIRSDHHNDATYSRLVPTFFLSLGCLAGLGAGVLAQGIRRWPRGGIVPRTTLRAVAAGTTAILVVALALLPPLEARLNEPYYRVFDAASWQAAADLAQSGVKPSDVFLSHPWQAPIYNAVTGAHPWTVLIPGEPPPRAADFESYMTSGGANATWLAERHIAWVVAPVPPDAAHASSSAWVHHLQASQ